MFERVLPETVKPFKLARQTAQLVGVVPLSAFENLVQNAMPIQDQVVSVQLAFETGPKGVALMSGNLNATVPFQCQRCLEPVVIELATHVKLAIFDGEIDEELMPEGYEPFQVETEQVRLVDLIEQEMILSAPIVPIHEDCEMLSVPGQESEASSNEISTQEDNPFKSLADLLAKGGQNQKK